MMKIKKIVKGYICCIKENVDINFTENQQFADIFEFCDENNFYLKSIYYDIDTISIFIVFQH